ncbi:DUF4833 domain-containing protein [Pyxidicoccus parkwayensis]|uniref:DUF4833 domain-containing protein n=1 Tax=Pyxidicoccus parkwayensis TaxID=2813578 RepID=A0ABX7NJ74_9BACT|nr:DUF4833 domain-containing protein [Pyxidicoccus parkwaysis]QSQ18869.1 DUF4833 domain-containing protein [Pyxidicoccus parkwaysis]
MRQRDWTWSGICLAVLLAQAPVFAGPPPSGTPPAKPPEARDADSAFFITRSTNKNQVHYGVRVDGDCKPQGPQPVHAYWRMLEKGEKNVEPLLGREGPAYGLAEAQQVESLPHGWRVHIHLRAWPERAIDLDVFRENDHCAARAFTLMEGKVAQIERIFVKAAFPSGVEYVLLSGTGPDGRSVREVIKK